MHTIFNMNKEELERLLRGRKLIEEMSVRIEEKEELRKLVLEKMASASIRLKTELEEIRVPSLQSLKE